MINFDNYTNENKTEHNSKWPYIPDHPYRILIIGGSGSGKTISQILIKYIYMQKNHLKTHFKDPRAFTEHSNDMQDVYNPIEYYNPNKKRKILIVFDDMIADMINNKKFNPVVIELFIKGRKLGVSIFFITQSYFKVPEDVRLNSTHFFIMKITNKRGLQQIALNH